MNTKLGLKMRDTTATDERVKAAMAEYGAVLAGASSSSLNQAVIRNGLAIVLGSYTLGGSRAECEQYAGRVVDLYIDWAVSCRGALAWYLDLELAEQFVGAAYLCGKTDALFRAMHGGAWVQVPEVWERAAFDSLFRAFGGQAPGARGVQGASVALPKPVQPVMPLLNAMIAQDRQAFATALSDFLLKSWGPNSEKGAKVELKSHWPLYTGKWSLLAAAACRRMGVIPDLPVKADLYLPRELI